MFPLLAIALLAACGRITPAAPTATVSPLHTVTPVPSVTPGAAPASLIHPGWTSYTNANWVTDLAFDAGGSLWAVGSGGAVRWDPQLGRHSKYTVDDGLASNTVLAIAFAPDGATWFGTSAGASRFDGRAWTTYTTADGFGSNTVHAIAVAPAGALWFGTAGGASRYLPLR